MFLLQKDDTFYYHQYIMDKSENHHFQLDPLFRIQEPKESY